MKYVGSIDSVNASLIAVIGDASLMKSWRGDVDDARSAAIARRISLAIGSGIGFALDLEMGQGVHRVFRLAQDHIVFVEAFPRGSSDDAEEFVEWATRPPSSTALKSGSLEITSGALAAITCIETGEYLEDSLNEVCAECALLDGSDRTSEWSLDGEAGDAGIALSIPCGTYDVLVETEEEGQWGSGRRCHVVSTTR